MSKTNPEVNKMVFEKLCGEVSALRDKLRAEVLSKRAKKGYVNRVESLVQAMNAVVDRAKVYAETSLDERLRSGWVAQVANAGSRDDAWWY